MKTLKSLLFGAGLLAVASCSEKGPQEIAVGKDQCDNCKMTITEPKYATQLLTEKGRIYKFDDIACLTDYESSNTDAAANATVYVADFPTGKFFDAKTATLIKGGDIKSPMGGNTQAFQNKEEANQAAVTLGATATTLR